MKLQLQAFPLKVPFKISYDHNLQKRACGDSVVLRVRDLTGIEAYGEATPRSYVTGEDSGKMLTDVDSYKSKVLDIFDGSMESLTHALDTIPAHLMSLRSLFEGALLDYISKKKDCSVFDLFNLSHDKVLKYTASLTGGSEGTFNKMLGMYAMNKMDVFKLKVTDDLALNVKRIKQVKETVGKDVYIRMDGNAIWNWKQADEQLPFLIEAGVNCFEQLFAKEDYASNELCIKKYGSDAEFIVDESITDDASLLKVLQSDIHGANLKISKNGGIIKCIEMANKLRNAGKTIRLGAHVGETSSLTLAGIIFALKVEDVKEMEGAAGEHLLLEDPFQPCISFGYKGQINVDAAFRKNVRLKYNSSYEMSFV